MTHDFQSYPKFHWIFTTHPTFLLNYNSMKVLINKIGQNIKQSIEKLKQGDVINLENLKSTTDNQIKHF